MPKDNRVALTDDGSSTLYSELFQAHYHSTHGALQESRHVFIEQGLHFYHQKHSIGQIRILEYGFGTGLNALLTAQYVDIHSIYSRYTTIEAYPVENEILANVNYGSLLSDEALFNNLHSSPWGVDIELTQHFLLHKLHDSFEKVHIIPKQHIIYYDAFAPSTQAHLWEEPMMKKCYDLLENDGILVTFCAKGSFKRALRAVGFTVERVPGPPGKREMTRATK